MQNDQPVGQAQATSTLPPMQSASQMGLNQPQKMNHQKSWVKAAIVAACILLACAGAVLLYLAVNKGDNRTYTLSDVTFSVTFDSSAKRVEVFGTQYLQGKDKTTGTVVQMGVHKTSLHRDCVATGTAEVVAKPIIDAETHNLCYSKSLNAYAMNFTHKNVWYNFTIYPKDLSLSSKMSQGFVEKAARSVKIIDKT